MCRRKRGEFVPVTCWDELFGRVLFFEILHKYTLLGHPVQDHCAEFCMAKAFEKTLPADAPHGRNARRMMQHRSGMTSGGVHQICHLIMADFYALKRKPSAKMCAGFLKLLVSGRDGVRKACEFVFVHLAKFYGRGLCTW